MVVERGVGEEEEKEEGRAGVQLVKVITFFTKA